MALDKAIDQFGPSDSAKDSGNLKGRADFTDLELGLARVRSAIRKAAHNSVKASNGNLHAKIYRNPEAFYQSYMEMERRFKIYVYEEGEIPVVHDGPCKSIYSSEGRFIHEMEHGNNSFRTRNPKAAYVYFLPFSVAQMVKYLYKPNSHDASPLKVFVSDYVRLISGPLASEGNAFLYNTSIRVLCNANSSEGFNPQKDASLPEINLYDGNINPKLRSPPHNNSRPYLAFFAGGVHGPIRPILLNFWKDRDKDLQVHEYLRKDQDYYDIMLSSKFCLCPSGYEVASPRIVEAIHAECIPVILSDHYVLPFSDVLRWEAFSIQVNIMEIPRLKEILLATATSGERYMRLRDNLRAVRRHFVLNQSAQRFDVFHMILHSVWLRRLNIRIR
ncbi:catalytic [Dorcoceras hygrometricum]|uniref:Catalytic n=1 Tax=Dorcoceras hygrometricum TaxID=472368 RepID=A0A2Z7CAA5_9LAMI|nr:catalytic [Dorcoceras hygrometricum]